jgi:type IV secretion system protein VirD4
MLPYDGLSPKEFLARIDTLLDDPGGRLMASSETLLAGLDPGQIDTFLTRRQGEAPSAMKHLAALAAIPFSPAAAGPAAWINILPSARTSALLGATLNHVHAKTTFNRRFNAVRSLISAFTIERPAVSLEDKEKGLVRGFAALFAVGRITPAVWDRFAARMTWNGGKCILIPDDGVAQDKHVPESRQALSELLAAACDGHPAYLAASSATVADEARAGGELGAVLQTFLKRGARWMTSAELAAGPVLSFDPSPAALIVGHEASSGRPVYYARNESLFSIGGPGTGKTECQVLPNLLSYKGSALVLDVKGELWEKTAGWRSKNCGPVYRFAPTDPDGRTHRYNPFDFVSNDAEQAATDCEVMSFQVVAPTANHHDPYWENRGRDFLWAMAMIVALRSKGRSRAMATLMRLLSVPFDVKPTSPDFASSETAALISGLEEMAVQYGIPALAEHANAIRGGLGSQRLESVADNARRFLSIFSRSASLRAAMAKSDWHPKQLRERPGTTVYLCLAGDDLDTYAPIVRLMLQQHANALLKDFRHAPGTPPITFFLDEFPQLKRMESIMRMVDTGRGAGLRLWFFAQYLGQVRHTYDKQADGLINACRVRSFLSPDAEAAEFIKPYLGTATNLFTGEKTPLAEPHELLGGAYADKILTLSSGPALLEKRFAWATMADRILPPPVIPRVR